MVKYTTVVKGLRYVGPEEYAETVGVCPKTVRRLCANGAVPGVIKVGGQWRIPVKEEER